MKMLSPLVLLACAVTLVACGDDSSPSANTCASSSTCTADQTCVDTADGFICIDADVAMCATAGNCAANEVCVDATSGFTCMACAAGTVSDGGGATSCVDLCASTTCEAYETCSLGACVGLLSAVSVSAGTLAFDPATTSYTVDVALTVSAVTFTATGADGVALTVQGVATPSGLPSDPVSLALGTTSVVIAASLGERTAVYTFDVARASDLQQQAYVKASNAGSNDVFGWSVALDGDTLVVGAEFESGDASSTSAATNDSAEYAGAAYVFVRNDATWTQQAYLKASNAGGDDNFGRSVAIDGDTVVVGAPGEGGDVSSTVASPNDNATNSGAVYVFTRSGAVWTQVAYLKGTNTETTDYFGRAVALDGDTLAVGASNESGSAASTAEVPNNSANGAGAAYVFVGAGAAWTQQAYLKASNAEAYDFFGTAVAVGGDTLVVSALGEAGDASSTSSATNNNANAAGAAYVFVRNSGSWTQQAYLKASNAGSNDNFGSAVALDGDTVVVGAPGESGDNNNTPLSGAAYVFARVDSTWTQQAYLKTSSPQLNSGLGSALALAGDTLVAGAMAEDDGAEDVGAAYVFVRIGATWTQQLRVNASNPDAFDNFGHAVALDGNTLVVGAQNEAGDASSTASAPNDNLSQAGAVYAFTL